MPHSYIIAAAFITIVCAILFGILLFISIDEQ